MHILREIIFYKRNFEYIITWSRCHKQILEQRSFAILNVFFKKNGPTPAYLCLFLFFSNTNFTENWRRQRDSNSDCLSRRQGNWPLDPQHGPLGSCSMSHDHFEPIRVLYLSIAREHSPLGEASLYGLSPV